jgi:EAL domain-containing protein (putative c-di-GMP-specific phosphodiesterase class I)
MILDLYDIKQSIDKKEFVLYYQPKILSINGKIIGAEALLRLKRNGEIFSPFYFIPLCEQTGFIPVLTEYVINNLFDDYITFKENNIDPHISFNISALDLKTRRIIKQLKFLSDGLDIDLKKFQIELTETMLIDIDQSSIDNLNELITIGLSIALDDFGASGFSSLEVLKKFPITVLKIDKGLIDNIEKDDKSYNIVMSILKLAHSIGIRTVAEGVENKASYHKLLFSGATSLQGYFLSKPLPIDEYIKFTKTTSKFPSNSIGLIIQAQSDHLAYRAQILSLFYYMCESPDNFKVTDVNIKSLIIEDNECALGKWYFSEEALEFNGLVEYDSLGYYHKEFHSISNYLLLSILGKEDLQSNRLKEMMREFHHKSTDIVDCLLKLEGMIHLKYLERSINNV